MQISWLYINIQESAYIIVVAVYLMSLFLIKLIFWTQIVIFYHKTILL